MSYHIEIVGDNESADSVREAFEGAIRSLRDTGSPAGHLSFTDGSTYTADDVTDLVSEDDEDFGEDDPREQHEPVEEDIP